jgi:chromosomal replication initiator protein
MKLKRRPYTSPHHIDTIDFILQVICRQLRISREEIESRDRHRDLMFPRWLAWALARKYTRLSLPILGAFFNRDHGAIIYGLKSLSNLVETEPSHRAQAETIERQVISRLQSPDASDPQFGVHALACQEAPLFQAIKLLAS